jgi:hypothetical protein
MSCSYVSAFILETESVLEQVIIKGSRKKKEKEKQKLSNQNR